MKKLFGTAMLAALLASSAFAELSVGVWQRVLWSPVAYNGGDVMTGEQVPWSGGRSGGAGLNWVSEDEKVGMSFTFMSNRWTDGDAFFQADGNNLIWAKPWDFLKLSLGHWDNAGGTDITSINTASWDWLRPWNWVADQLYNENEDTGALIEVTPVENLWIGVGLPFGLTSTKYDEVVYYDKNGKELELAEEEKEYKKVTSTSADDIAYHMFEALRADVAYTIPDVLKVMVGWRGGRAIDPNYKKNASTFNVVGQVNAFVSLLAVEELQLDVGTRIKIYGDSDYKKNKDIALVGIKAGYNILDNFSIKADFAIQLYDTVDPQFQFGVGAGYGFTDSLSLIADFRATLPNRDKEDPTFSFLVGLNYACSSNAVVGIGFQGKTNGGGFGPLAAKDDNFGFAVPILVNVWF